MHCQASVDQWQTTRMQHLPQLSKPQATVLALWSLGLVLARSCSLPAVRAIVAAVWNRQEATRRQRLRAWDDEAPAQRGAKRQALPVAPCVAPLVGWIVRWGQGTPWAVAREAPTVGTCVVVLAVRGGSRGCALPGAWVILPATPPHAWRGAWLRLGRRLGRVVPRHGTVLVLADRGRYAPWLWRRLGQLGWHPLVRPHTGGTFRPAGPRCFRPLAPFVPQVGTRWQGRGTACARKPRRLACPLLACGEAGEKAPWLSRTALAPEASAAGWYGLRAWRAPGFQRTKRAGGPWHRTRMTDPARAARLWLAVAVATLGGVRGGGAATIPAGTLPDVRARCPGDRRPRRATRWRLVSVLRRGWLTL
jgi:hypothetical protein